jgi:hypothetical protein
LDPQEWKRLPVLSGHRWLTCPGFSNVPILLVVKDAESFQFPQEIKREAALGWVPAPIPVEEIGSLDKFYAISLNGHPHFGKTVTVIAKKDTGLQAEDGDYVIYCCPKGIGHIGKVKLFPDKVSSGALTH